MGQSCTRPSCASLSRLKRHTADTHDMCRTVAGLQGAPGPHGRHPGPVMVCHQRRERVPPFQQARVHAHVGKTSCAVTLCLILFSRSFHTCRSMDRTVRLWHASSDVCLRVFEHGDFVTCVAFYPKDHRYFLAGEWQHVINPCSPIYAACCVPPQAHRHRSRRRRDRGRRRAPVERPRVRRRGRYQGRRHGHVRVFRGERGPGRRGLYAGPVPLLRRPGARREGAGPGALDPGGSEEHIAGRTRAQDHRCGGGSCERDVHPHAECCRVA